MRKTNFMFAAAILALSFLACKNGNAEKAAAEEQLKTEILALDSLNNELDDLTSEIESNTQALETALGELNFEGE